MNADRCIRQIIDNTGTSLSKQEVGQIMEMLIAYDVHPRNQQVFGPFSPEQGRVQTAIEGAVSPDQLAVARDILIARARVVAAQQRANVVMDAAKRADRFATYANAGDEALGVQAKLIGTNTPFLGNRDSAAAAIEANTFQLLGEFDAELKAAGVDRLFASGAMERDWTRELYELNRTTPGPRRPVTNNPQALQIARIVQNLQRRGLEMVNREGAYVGSYDGYISRTTHSSDLIRRMGEDAWVGYAQQYFDIATIYPNRTAQHIEEQLRAQYKRIASGKHDSYDPEELDLIANVPGQNMAKKVSESRVIHFRDAESWLNYMAVASDQTPSQVIIGAAQKAARDAALMRIWGTNPKASLAADVQLLQQQARDRGDFDAVDRLATQERSYNLWMGYMTGEANQVHNQTWARITSNTLAIQRMGKLGFLPFAQLVDLASVGGELRYQGVGFIDRMTASLSGYFRGGVGSEKRQVADLLGAYFEGELSQYNAHLEINDPRMLGGFTGRVNRLQDIFFRYSGAQALTNRARGGLLHMMSRHMGAQYGTLWARMDEPERRIMEAFNIGEHEWAALNRAMWTVGAEGNTFLTPRDAMNIPDAAIAQYNVAVGRVWEYGEFRDAMAQRLYSYYADRMGYGVLSPGVGEKALLYFGAKPGSPLGVALRLITQFKSFMVANFRRTWGREINGGQGALGAMAGIAEYAVTGATLGVLANGMNQLFKGQDPFSQWENDPTSAVLAGLTRAGTSSVIGDFLFSPVNRHSQNLAEYALGPTVGSAQTLWNAVDNMRKGENPSGDLLRFTRGLTPFSNLWYTKLGLDYLIWNGLTEASNPGYLRRTERNMKKTQGLEFLKRPVDMSPNQWRAF